MSQNPPPRTTPPRQPAGLSPAFAIGGAIIAVLMVVLLITNRPQQGTQTGSAASETDCTAYAGTPESLGETVTTASGLQYQVLRPGIGGAQPTASSTVTVNYEGRLESGSVFDSSYQRGQPATFPLNRVIAGWTEGLQLMSRCAKYRFTIPGNLAYGAAGQPNAGIGPNATLIFDVELLNIQ